MQDFWTVNSITTFSCHVLFELPLPYLLPSFYPTYEPPSTVPKSMDSVSYTLSIITINFHYQYYIIICYHKNLVSLLSPYHHYSQYIPIPKNHVSISPEFLLPASKLSTTRHLTSYGHPSRPIRSAMVLEEPPMHTLSLDLMGWICHGNLRGTPLPKKKGLMKSYQGIIKGSWLLL